MGTHPPLGCGQSPNSSAYPSEWKPTMKVSPVRMAGARRVPLRPRMALASSSSVVPIERSNFRSFLRLATQTWRDARARASASSR